MKNDDMIRPSNAAAMALKTGLTFFSLFFLNYFFPCCDWWVVSFLSCVRAMAGCY